jgi:hypothetical protein
MDRKRSYRENRGCKKLQPEYQLLIKSTFVHRVLSKNLLHQVWWCPLVIPAFVRLRQGDCKFKASLGYIVRLCKTLKKENHFPSF